MKQYTCVECGEIYNDANNPPPATMVCQKATCSGGGLCGIIIPNEQLVQGSDSNNKTTEQNTPQPEQKELSLCILLMDASAGMGKPAFEGYSFPSKYYGEIELAKREVIADRIAAAIFRLSHRLRNDSAYICTIKFDHRQSVMFTESVTNIINRHGTVQNLAKYFHNELVEYNGGLDVNSALKLAHDLTEKFIHGFPIGCLGDYIPTIHTMFLPKLNKSIGLPGVRVRLYTGGQHLSQYGAIRNPFEEMKSHYLFIAFIGQETDSSCQELKAIVGNCPFHQEPQFFVSDKPQKSIKNVTSGRFFLLEGGDGAVPGFCPLCVKNE